jgi:Rieske Fe-S protein
VTKVAEKRRSFLARLTGGVVGVGALLTSWPLVRSLFPNVLYEPPRRFPVGLPEAFQPGVTFLDAQRVFLFRSANGFHAVSGICSHLGCTVKFAPYKQPKEQTVPPTTRGRRRGPSSRSTSRSPPPTASWSSTSAGRSIATFGWWSR